MKIAVYSGTFDPLTNGHLSVLERAAKLFGKVFVAVAEESYKTPLFSMEERIKLIEESAKHLDNVYAESFSGLLVDFAKEKNAVAIVRGLRVISDFEYEMQMASFNKYLAEGLDTVFLTAASHFSFVSSSMIKNIASLGGDVSAFVPPSVDRALKNIYQKQN